MTEQELIERAERFLSRIAPAPIPAPLAPVRLTIAELRTEDDWGGWRNMPGVYYFVRNDELVYVGRAVPSQKLGNRVGSHIDEEDGSDWGLVVSDKNTVVGVIAFPHADWHWLAALEFHLIDVDPRPKFNKRF